MADKPLRYIVVVQCHTVREVCAGYFCEKAFTERTGGFAQYAKDSPLRINYMTCGGCCGKSTLRKLMNLAKNARKHEGIEPEQIVVHLSSCITKDNHHSTRCPHVEYIRSQVARSGLTCVEDTHISAKAKHHREEGVYGKNDNGVRSL